MKRIIANLVATMALAAGIASLPAVAQSPSGALPTAPGAQKAVDGGLSQAPASLPGYGASPLEPYLVVWLLPVSGIVVAVVFAAVDKRVRRAT